MAGLITPLIMCGGAGTRLQPISRESLPKQFLPLFADHSTFQETALRLRDPGLFATPVIITHHSCQGHVERQLKALRAPAEIILEPERKGSGPAILAGTLHIAATRGGDAMVLALAADHVVRDGDGFRRTCRAALDAARSGAIVTFGIVPDHAATGYGYIEPGEVMAGNARSVRRFIEKPDADSAARHMRDGLLWNSGNFLFQAPSLIDEYRRFDAETVEAVNAAMQGAAVHSHVVRPQDSAFARAAGRSIDYALMEKTARAAVVPALHDWTDIGSWQTIYTLLRGGQGGGPHALRCISVQPGEVLALPRLRQAEYWIVASGGGVAMVDTTSHPVKANEFVYISPGSDGHIANRGESELTIVVVSADILLPEPG